MGAVWVGVKTCDECGGRLREAPEVKPDAELRQRIREARDCGLRLNAVRVCTACHRVQLSFFSDFVFGW